MSAGGHTMLTLAGGRWSPAVLREHCMAHLEEDFVTCVGPATTSLNGDSLDRIKLSLARWVIGWKLDDSTSYGHADARIAAVVAGVPHAAAFDFTTLATPRVPLGLITARGDVWLVPRFHGLAVVKACAGCEWLTDLAEGGHGALLSPHPRREGRIAELVNDPPGFDRSIEVPAINARVVDFFKRQSAALSSTTVGHGRPPHRSHSRWRSTVSVLHYRRLWGGELRDSNFGFGSTLDSRSAERAARNQSASLGLPPGRWCSGARSCHAAPGRAPGLRQWSSCRHRPCLSP